MSSLLSLFRPFQPLLQPFKLVCRGDQNFGEFVEPQNILSEISEMVVPIINNNRVLQMSIDTSIYIINNNIIYICERNRFVIQKSFLHLQLTHQTVTHEVNNRWFKYQVIQKEDLVNNQYWSLFAMSNTCPLPPKRFQHMWLTSKKLFVQLIIYQFYFLIHWLFKFWYYIYPYDQDIRSCYVECYSVLCSILTLF